MQENITLKIGFWFGEKTPSLQQKDILTATLSMEHLLRDYEDFEVKYREFKKRNPNPTVAYKNTLEEEECLLLLPEPMGVVITTFYHLKEIALTFYQADIKSKECEDVSIEKIFDKVQINKIFSIYQKSLDKKLSFQKELKTYFLTFEQELLEKGYVASYLSYAVAFAIENSNNSEYKKVA